jgi:hypothetical protein
LPPAIRAGILAMVNATDGANRPQSPVTGFDTQ